MKDFGLKTTILLNDKIIKKIVVLKTPLNY